jgi:hypothetical protein
MPGAMAEKFITAAKCMNPGPNASHVMCVHHTWSGSAHLQIAEEGIDLVASIGLSEYCVRPDGASNSGQHQFDHVPRSRFSAGQPRPCDDAARGRPCGESDRLH